MSAATKNPAGQGGIQVNPMGGINKMSMTEATDTDKSANAWTPNPQMVACTDPDCIAALHEVDIADKDDEAFHTAYLKDDLGLWSVRVTRFESNNWVLDIDAEPAMGVIFAQALIDTIAEAIALTSSLNAKRNGGNA